MSTFPRPTEITEEDLEFVADDDDDGFDDHTSDDDISSADFSTEDDDEEEASGPGRKLASDDEADGLEDEDEDEGEKKGKETEDALREEEKEEEGEEEEVKEGEEEAADEKPPEASVKENGILSVSDEEKTFVEFEVEDGDNRYAPLSQVKKDALRAVEADEQLGRASEMVAQVNRISEAVKRDPLGTALHMITEEHGYDVAYRTVLEAAQKVVGEELEWQGLPEEERMRRKLETEMARKDREIERLNEKERGRAQKDHEEAQLKELIREAQLAKLDAGDTATLRGIGIIYDQQIKMQKPITIKEATKRYVEQQKAKLKSKMTSLSKEELEALGFRQYKPRKPPKRIETPKKKPSTRRQGKAPVGADDQGYFKNWGEARKNA